MEITKIYSAAGLLPEDTALITERPFLSPHHSVTRAVLIGGGNTPAPGLITLAHLGVLFLDEISEYKPAELNSLREPLENHEIVIRRLNGAYRYPARPLLVAASNVDARDKIQAHYEVSMLKSLKLRVFRHLGLFFSLVIF